MVNEKQQPKNIFLRKSSNEILIDKLRKQIIGKRLLNDDNIKIEPAYASAQPLVFIVTLLDNKKVVEK